MKHHVCAVLFFVNSLFCTVFDRRAVLDKEYLIGRFSDVDSFDIDQVEKILKQLPATVKKNIENLLYPADGNELPQRLLLLGGVRNANTTAIAKAIALRWGYDYYVIEAVAFLQANHDKRDFLLSEARSIRKPIVFIITELPEMRDYFELYACTLEMLIDQCAQYSNAMVIATSAYQHEQLPDHIKEKFSHIVSLTSNEPMQAKIKMSWIEKNKTACVVTACALAALCIGTQIFYTVMCLQQQNENILLNQQVTDLCNVVGFIKAQSQSFQKQQSDIQKQLDEMKRRR
jgi:hypothetical protein